MRSYTERMENVPNDSVSTPFFASAQADLLLRSFSTKSFLAHRHRASFFEVRRLELQ